jgi:hypothetical protein
MKRQGATAQQRALIRACLDAGVPFFWRGPGTLLIEKGGLADVVPAIIAGGETVLGFEGFELEGPHVHPRLDLMVDLGSGPSGMDPLEAVSGWPGDVWVDVALRP